MAQDDALDLLRGADQIASFIYPDDPNGRRKIYHNGAGWPLFRDGGILCALRSEIRKHAEALQQKAVAERAEAKQQAAKSKPACAPKRKVHKANPRRVAAGSSRAAVTARP